MAVKNLLRVLVPVLVWACGPLPWQQEESAAGKSWQVLHEGEDLGGPLLGAWGWDAQHVLFAGGSVGNGAPATAYVVDGSSTRALQAGGTDTWWWTHGTAADDIWLVGEHGRITHHDGTNFTEHPRLTDATLWGVFALSRTEAYAVGGVTGRPDPMYTHDVVLRFDGTSWTQETLPGEPRNAALLKVWGSPTDGVYVVGEKGTIWHRVNGTWTLESPGGGSPVMGGTLLSVHGCEGGDVYAVGGAVLLRKRAGTWSLVPAIETGIGNAVACTGTDEAVVVGFGGLKLRVKGESAEDDTLRPPYLDLHAIWVAPDGAVWVGGGDWTAQPMAGFPREGVIARYGVPVSARSITR